MSDDAACVIRAFQPGDAAAVVELWRSCGLRSDNSAVVAFYGGLGYAEDEVTVLGKRLIPDL